MESLCGNKENIYRFHQINFHNLKKFNITNSQNLNKVIDQCIEYNKKENGRDTNIQYN